MRSTFSPFAWWVEADGGGGQQSRWQGGQIGHASRRHVPRAGAEHALFLLLLPPPPAPLRDPRCPSHRVQPPPPPPPLRGRCKGRLWPATHLHKVDGRHIGDGLPVGLNGQVQRHAQPPQVVDAQQGRHHIAAEPAWVRPCGASDAGGRRAQGPRRLSLLPSPPPPWHACPPPCSPVHDQHFVQVGRASIPSGSTRAWRRIQAEHACEQVCVGRGGSSQCRIAAHAHAGCSTAGTGRCELQAHPPPGSRPSPHLSAAAVC